jgi:hypothetical protein
MRAFASYDDFAEMLETDDRETDIKKAKDKEHFAKFGSRGGRGGRGRGGGRGGAYKRGKR